MPSIPVLTWLRIATRRAVRDVLAVRPASGGGVVARAAGIDPDGRHYIDVAYDAWIDDDREGLGFGLFVENHRFGIYRMWSRFYCVGK